MVRTTERRSAQLRLRERRATILAPGRSFDEILRDHHSLFEDLAQEIDAVWREHDATVASVRLLWCAVLTLGFVSMLAAVIGA